MHGLAPGLTLALHGLLQQGDRLVHLYTLVFDFVDPGTGVQHISQLLSARSAALEAAAAWSAVEVDELSSLDE